MIKPSQQYQSLDDENVVLGSEIITTDNFSLYNKQIEEILLLPKDIITLGTLRFQREKHDVSSLIGQQSIILGEIEGKKGYRDVKTGKFLGEENIPGRNPMHDIKMNWLDENGRYMAVNGNKIHMRGSIDPSTISMYYSNMIADILGFEIYTGTDWELYEKHNSFLGKQLVLEGTTGNLDVPSAERHAGTGICLSGNTGGKKGDTYYNVLHGYRIEDHTQH